MKRTLIRLAAEETPVTFVLLDCVTVIAQSNKNEIHATLRLRSGQASSGRTENLQVFSHFFFVRPELLEELW
jgi:hypothetical protein